MPNRRDFLRTAGAVTGGALLAGAAATRAGATRNTTAPRVPRP